MVAKLFRKLFVVCSASLLALTAVPAASALPAGGPKPLDDNGWWLLDEGVKLSLKHPKPRHRCDKKCFRSISSVWVQNAEQSVTEGRAVLTIILPDGRKERHEASSATTRPLQYFEFRLDKPFPAGSNVCATIGGMTGKPCSAIDWDRNR